MFNISCGCRCQRFPSPLESFLSFFLTLGSPSPNGLSLLETSCVLQVFSWNPWLFYWSFFGMVPKCGGEGTFDNIASTSQSFSWPISWHCCFHKWTFSDIVFPCASYAFPWLQYYQFISINPWPMLKNVFFPFLAETWSLKAARVRGILFP